MTSDRTNWEQHRIQALIDSGALVVNDGYRAKNTELGDVGLPFARASNVNNGFRLDDADRLLWDRVERAGIKRSRPGDVVFTSKGTVGRFALVRESTPEFVYSPQLCFWRVLDSTKIEARFLHYWMHGRECERQFNAAKGSTDMADYISLRDQRSMSITFPPVAEQRCIASVLGSLDDKIDSNNRLTSTFEDMAATLFKARFTDVAGRDTLVEKEIGSLPRGWDLRRLDEVASVLTRGRAPVYVDEGGILVLNQKCVRDGRVMFEVARRHDEQARSSEDRRVALGDVLVNSTGVGTLGRVSQVRWLPESSTVDSHVTVVRAASDVSQDYLALSLISRQEDLERMGHGSTGQTELTRSRLAEMQIPLPPRAEQEQLDGFYRPIREKIGAMERENTVLSEIRNRLLPKLISGAIRLGDAAPTESPA